MATNWFTAPAPVARRVRAYFAPVNRAGRAPVLFDPAEQGAFNLDAPPAPWVSLGWIQEFTRKTASKTAAVMTGIPASPLGQVRETLSEQIGHSVRWLDSMLYLLSQPEPEFIEAGPGTVLTKLVEKIRKKKS